MENIKYNLFDLFSYAIPGAILSLFIFTVLPNLMHYGVNKEIEFLNLIIKVIEGANLNSFLVVIVISYILGFITSCGVSVLTQLLKRKNKMFNHDPLTMVWARDYSKEAYSYIERYNSMRVLCWNLSLNIALISLWFNLKTGLNLSIILITLIGITFLIIQGVIFNKWSYKDLNSLKQLRQLNSGNR